MLENAQKKNKNPLDFIKNPAVLEFLNLPTNYSHTEAQLEKALIDNLQKIYLRTRQRLCICSKATTYTNRNFRFLYRFSIL